MDSAAALRALGGLVVPPRCAVCAAASTPGQLACGRCRAAIEAGPAGRGAVAGIGSVPWAAPYRGPARDLVGALKFRAGLGLATLAGAAIATALEPDPAPWTVVAVPPAPLRTRRRGFDPAQLIATEVGRRLGLATAAPLRRCNGPRQVGRPRHRRLADPPRIRIAAPAPARALLVDDVLTTGATLAACAAVLRRAGAGEVRGAVFARALDWTGPGPERTISTTGPDRKERG